METFITKIKVNESRRVKDLEIPLSEESRQHLIITGKNGSGKTSLLENINKTLHLLEASRIFYSRSPLPNSDVAIDFSINESQIAYNFQRGEFLLAFFDAKRPNTKLKIPKGIKKVELKQRYGLDERANTDFLQYIVNQKADQAFARDEKEDKEAKKIYEWFEGFEKQLQSLFDEPSLKLSFDRKSYNFNIIINNYEPFDFNTLSDGYAAIISIVTELILRMEAHNVKAYDLEGIVVVDEIETHLHVDLQKRIMPFLISFFPKIQFIVTTHSPFVLSSVPNATICDLEKRIITTDLSAYSYDALLESYFMIDKYSEEVKEMVKEYESLACKKDKTMDEAEHLRYLADYFAHAPKYLSDELHAKLQQIKLANLKQVY